AASPMLRPVYGTSSYATPPHSCRPPCRPLSALQFPRRVGVSRSGVVGDAIRIRGTRRNRRRRRREIVMSDEHADAFVFFGATGDLAYKKIFPALQTMVKRGHLDVPVIGVAKAGWTLDELRARARDSVERHGGLDAAAFPKLSRLLRHVD